MIYLDCPYAQREIAKSNGARWDADRKQWYYPGDALPDGLRQFEINENKIHVCKICGQSGKGGAYPFSTLPASFLTCDDCC